MCKLWVISKGKHKTKEQEVIIMNNTKKNVTYVYCKTKTCKNMCNKSMTKTCVIVIQLVVKKASSSNKTYVGYSAIDIKEKRQNILLIIPIFNH